LGVTPVTKDPKTPRNKGRKIAQLTLRSKADIIQTRGKKKNMRNGRGNERGLEK